MIRRIKKLEVSIGFVLLCFIIFYLYNNYIAKTNHIITLSIEKGIRNEYKGVVLELYSGRKYVGLTHMKVKLSNNEILDFSPTNQIIKNISVSDSIIKLKNENYILVKKPNGTTKKYIDALIPDYVRNDPDWPKEWRGKWMDATLEWRRVFGKEASEE